MKNSRIATTKLEGRRESHEICCQSGTAIERLQSEIDQLALLWVNMASHTQLAAYQAASSPSMAMGRTYMLAAQFLPFCVRV